MGIPILHVSQYSIQPKSISSEAISALIIALLANPDCALEVYFAFVHKKKFFQNHGIRMVRPDSV